MSPEPQDEYGVYERLAALETKVAALERERDHPRVAAPAPSAPVSPAPNPLVQILTQSNPVFWLIIAAMALGNGPDALQTIAKVLLK